jgi:acyl-CoA synthetase (AMP-forming)/AMP-acid ligase II
MKIVDPESKKELGYYEIGDVCVKSQQVMLEYLNMSASTATIKDGAGRFICTNSSNKRINVCNYICSFKFDFSTVVISFQIYFLNCL